MKVVSVSLGAPLSLSVSVAVLRISGGQYDLEQEALVIHHQIPLVSLYLLVRVAARLIGAPDRKPVAPTNHPRIHGSFAAPLLAQSDARTACHG
jgi:hypothetical protein